MDIQFTNYIIGYPKLILSCSLAFLFSTFLTWLVYHFTLRNSILDIPNERSSHQNPTPRGGGIAIVLTFIPVILWLGYINFIPSNLFWAMLGGGVLLACIGCCDDWYSIKIGWRLLIQFLAAAWAMYWLGAFSHLTIGTLQIPLHLEGYIITALGMVWCINLYNFMDGIDGLAGTEGIFIAFGTGVALWLVGSPNLALVLWLLVASVAGFTLWNWPPAKIFLGDVGSLFLGYLFSVIGLYTINEKILSFSFWWIIAGIFICDATLTLFTRVYQGKRWYSGHREHAFCHLTVYGLNHKQVTIWILCINCFVLLPIALATLYWPSQSLWYMLSTTALLGFIWYWIKSLEATEFKNNLSFSSESVE